MATVDNLEIQIEGSAKKANDAIDSLITNLGRLANSLKIDTSGLEKIGKSLNLSGITSGAKNIQSQARKVSKSLSQIMEQYKDLGKGFEIKGSTQQIQKKIDSLTNQLAKAKLAKEDFETSGKTNLSGYETAVKNVIKYTNQIESLKKQLAGINGSQTKPNFNITGAESATKYLVEYKKQLMDFKNDIKSIGNVYGGLQNVPKGGLDTPIQNLKISIEELKQSYPQATNVISAFEKELQKLQGISAGLTREPMRTNIETSSIDRVNEKITELKNKFEKSGLDFKFTGNFEQLNTEIEKVYSKLNELKTKEQEMISAGQVNTSGFEQLQESLARVGNKFGIMQDLRDRTEAFNQSLQQLRVPEIREENLAKLQDALRKTEKDIENLRIKLANAITTGKITPNVDDSGFRNLTQKIAESEKQAEALKEKISQIGTGENKTSKETNNLSNAFSRLRTNTGGVSNSINGLGKSLNKTLSGMKSVTRSILSAAGIMGGIYGIIRGGMSAIDIASQLTEVQNVVDVTFGSMAYKVEEFAKNSIEQFGMSELALKQYSSRFQAMGTAMGFPIDRMSDMSVELTKLTADMSSFYNVEQKDVAKSLEAIFTGQTRPLRQYGIDLTQATLQEWALKQGIDANVQSMSQAEKTMLRYQYVLANTKAAQGDFARTVDTWANQVRILKQNIQQLASIIGKTLINALKPLVKALNVAMGHLINFAKVVSNSLGKIFGWTYEESGGGIATDFEDAEDAAGGIADGLGQAAGNAKKLKQQLQGFDELNVLNIDDDALSGGGASGTGGTGGLSGAGAAGGEWKKTDSILKTYESELDTLYKLGASISARLSAAMESIDWDSVYEKARGFGKGLADFLNGLINPRLFGDVGKTIASSLNTAIYSLNSFGKTFEFDEFGNSIAEGINEFFNTFDFAELADTLNTWADGIWDTIVNIIAGIEWENVFRGIIETLSKLDIDTTLTIAWFMLGQKTAISAIGNLLKKEVKTNLGTLTVSKILGISITTAIIGFKIGNWLYDHVPTIQEWADSFAKWLFDGGDKLNVGKTLTLTLSALTVTFATVSLTKAALKAIGDRFKKALVSDTVTSAMGSGVSSGLDLGITSKLGTLAAIGSAIVAGLQIGKWLDEVFGEWTDKALAWMFGNPSEKVDKETRSKISYGISEGMDFETWAAQNPEASSWNSAAKVAEMEEEYNRQLEAHNKYLERVNETTKDTSKTTVQYAAAVGLAGANTDAMTKAAGIASNILSKQTNKALNSASSDFTKSSVVVHNFSKDLNAANVNSVNISNTLKNAFSKIIKPVDNVFKGLSKTTTKLKEFTNEAKNKITINATNEDAKKTIDDTKNTLDTFVNSFNPSVKLGADDTKVTKTKENVQSMIATFVDSFQPNVKLGADASKVNTTQNSVRSTLTAFTAGFQPSVVIGANAGNVYDAQNSVRSTLTAFTAGFQPSVKIKADTSSAINSVNTLAEKIKNTIRNGITAGVSIGAAAGALGKLNINVKGYAGGGFPDTYSMFMAGERGKAEILGTVGGKTAVAGGQEITGIRDAINSANQREAMLLRTMINLLQVIADKDTSISQSDVYNAVRRENRQRYNQTGVNALLY